MMALTDTGERCAVATVIETRGSASARPGNRGGRRPAGQDPGRAGWVAGAQSTLCNAALECGRGWSSEVSIPMQCDCLPKIWITRITSTAAAPSRGPRGDCDPAQG